MILYSDDRNRGSGDDESWAFDLGDRIARQTMKEAVLGEDEIDPSLSAASDSEDEIEEMFRDDEDAALFDELLDEDTAGRPAKGRKAAKAGNGGAVQSGRRSRTSDEEYDEEDDEGGKSARRSGSSRRERREEKREEKEYREYQKYKKAKKKKKRHRLLKVLGVLLILILLLYAIGTIALRLLGIQTTLTGLSDLNEGVAESTAMSGYTNIALFGVDSRDEDLGEGNRTDVMILASINNLTGDIKLVSVYRDTYLDIGDGNYQKANAAYAYGGAAQAINMLNTNLDLDITDYATIGFVGVADLIDAVGGVEITVTEEEIEHLNNYQLTMAQEMGVSYTEVTTAGTQTLNGLQAVAYCRIRYTDGGDFQRTERQKEVLTKAFSKLKSSGPLTIIQAATDLSDEIETSLSTSEIVSLAMKVFMYDITDTNGFPNEDLRTTGYIGDASCVIPITLSANVTWLHEYLFDDTGYEPSDTVQEISAYISSVTGYY